MPKGVRLSEEQRGRIYTAFVMGEQVEDIAAQYGISDGHTRKVIRDQRKARESTMASREKVVAGDKRNGRLTSTTDPHRYEGTCVVGGKSKSKLFMADNARRATEMWEKWCKGLRDEQAFMDMVARNVEVAPQQPDEPEVRWSNIPVTYGTDTVDAAQPAKPVEPQDDETASEVQQEFDAITEKHLEATGVPLADTSEPAYLIWAKSPEPRCYGLYLTMESALAEADKLNEVARFLGNGGAFEVEEVAWK